MTPPNVDMAAAVSELANALPVARPVASRMRHRADEPLQEAERLEAALTRAAHAVRRLRPPEGGSGQP
jgi:hypothetical protein